MLCCHVLLLLQCVFVVMIIVESYCQGWTTTTTSVRGRGIRIHSRRRTSSYDMNGRYNNNHNIDVMIMKMKMKRSSSSPPQQQQQQQEFSRLQVQQLPMQSIQSGSSRRTVLISSINSVVMTNSILIQQLFYPNVVLAEQEESVNTAVVQVSISGEVLKLFNEGRALEMQGNVAAAQRLYMKVTQIVPQYIYGWSNLGNTQTTFGDLENAEISYNTAITLCNISLEQTSADTFGVKRCNDLYILLLNRGCLRLNTGQIQEALYDLRQAEQLRGKPDAIILQNLARAYELNGYYDKADYDYTLAIGMTANEVNPFWIRSALVKFQLGEYQSGYDLLKRVINRFPDAPEVRAAYSVFLLERSDGDMTAAQQKFLEIPDKQRLKYSNREYMTKTICWPPAMIDRLNKIAKAVGDDKRVAQ